MSLWSWLRRGRPGRPDWAALTGGDELWESTLAACPGLRRLPGPEAADLRRLAGEFWDNKSIEGVQGLELEAGMVLRVAVWACLPVLRLGLSWYDDWHNIFLCPTGFSDRRQRMEAGGIMTEWDDELAGEVLELGPVVLSWEDVLAAGQGTGYNVVIHELAHKLDARNGSLDGAPPLPPDEAREWRRVFGAAWDDFNQEVASAERRMRLGRAAGSPRLGRGHARLSVDPYAAEAPEEFFAVLCEQFFDRPLGLKARWPELYGCLERFFKLDPAAWI